MLASSHADLAHSIFIHSPLVWLVGMVGEVGLAIGRKCILSY